MGVYKKIKSTAGPDNYQSGGFTVTIGELEKIEKALAYGQGYIVGITGIAGNVATVAVYTVAGGEVSDGTDLSSKTFVVVAEGY